MQWIMALFVGIGLSASCGFRIFVPLLGMNIAHHAGHLALSPGFEWIGSWPATIAFGVATIVEVGGYYIPWVDNLLDSIATPGAVVAGTLITASMIGDASPFLRWTLALVAGGGVAGAIQASSVLVRGTSTATTGGAGNPVVSTGELLAAIAGTVISIVSPYIAIALVALIMFLILRRIFRRRAKSSAL
ncbi:DUF4126 domain-containing protein [Candidatus Zixiibacteriota bacterium]